jgi:hypothetical protein
MGFPFLDQKWMRSVTVITRVNLDAVMWIFGQWLT